MILKVQNIQLSCIVHFCTSFRPHNSGGPNNCGFLKKILCQTLIFSLIYKIHSKFVDTCTYTCFTTYSIVHANRNSPSRSMPNYILNFHHVILFYHDRNYRSLAIHIYIIYEMPRTVVDKQGSLLSYKWVFSNDMLEATENYILQLFLLL